MSEEHLPDGHLHALKIVLKGGPADNHVFFAYPGRVTSILTIGLTEDNSKHFYAYDAQTNKTTYLGPQHLDHIEHPVIAWIDPPQRETK